MSAFVMSMMSGLGSRSAHPVTMSKTCERVIVVTGSSSGIGHALACRLSTPFLSKFEKSVQVVATMREPD